MARYTKASRQIDQNAARIGVTAHSIRELEKSIRRAAWDSLMVDYYLGGTYKPSDPVKLSKRTQRLFKDADNVAAKRRRYMKKAEDKR